MVSEIKKGNKTYFQAVSPQNLADLLKSKEKNFLEILPELMKIYTSKVKKPIIEIFQGVEGLKTIMNDMIKTKSQILIFNQIEDKKILNYIPDFYLKRYFDEIIKANIKVKVLYSYKTPLKHQQNYQYKKLNKGQLGNVGYWIYGEKVVIGIWTEYPLLIKIQDTEVASTFRSGFNLIWNSIK